MTVQDAFRELRTAWFNTVLKRKAHEREWEPADRETQRELDNFNLKAIFDDQTEGIIEGDDFTVAPRCSAEMD